MADWLPDAPDTRSLGSIDREWLNLYIGDAGKIFFGLAQDVELFRDTETIGLGILIPERGLQLSSVLAGTSTFIEEGVTNDCYNPSFEVDLSSWTVGAGWSRSSVKDRKSVV